MATAPIQPISPSNRPPIVGSSSGPTPPYPIFLEGEVKSGFGRGSKELGCPTANLPDESFEKYQGTMDNGVFCGFAKVFGTGSGEDTVHEMVMSVGWNPYYKNEKKTAEVHIMHDFGHDFYGKIMKVIVLAYIRPQFDYVSKEALIEDIEVDKQVATRTLEQDAWKEFAKDKFFESASATA
ncbi:riboflavin kinase [Atractiella rhizophila]|nr:riboflavin kinase [Atractiella rhizophila]